MSSILPTFSTEFDDLSCFDTPVAQFVPQIPIIDAPDLMSTDAPSLASTLKLPDSSTQYLSPTLSAKPVLKPVLSLADVLDVSGIKGLEMALGLEVGSLDITVAADGSFIETSSGPALREIKRRYDQLAGVSISVRSPYTVTGFVNQHGRHMYRFSHRDETAPAASAAEVEERILQSKANDLSNSPKTKRRSRLSMHFPQTMFAKPTAAASRPPTASSTTSTSSRKLRKTRSIPDMFVSGPIVTNAPTFSVTGRAHSQSVTAADLPRPSMPINVSPLERKIDYFGELMDWFTPASSASSGFSSHSLFNHGKVSSDPTRPRATVAQPFGHGVIFNIPSQRPVVEHMPTPRHLRLMQSFDSSVTARQVAPSDNMSEMDIPLSDDINPAADTSRPTSGIRLSMLSSILPGHEGVEAETVSTNEGTATPLNITPSVESLRLSSHYSTEVFNVLQTYRGLPLFENLVPESGEDATVIKLSLANDQSATPRDDPRFVIWGEIATERENEDYHSNSRDSLTDNPPMNNSSLSISKRRSSRVSKLKSPEQISLNMPDAPAPKVLLAATIERWIAQLTSDLNYDELLNFFLTYRTYVSAVDLCHLLICRFHWALQPPTSTQDETVRRIVRVRTFVGIRYWLLTFFTVDFIPNRELRLLISDWLNTLINDPILKKHSDATDIVRRLIKVAKECKRVHIRVDEKPKSSETPKGPADQSLEQLLGKSFAEATRKPPVSDNISELDLGFLPDDAKTDDSISGFPSDPANAHLSAGNALGGVLTGSRPTSLPLSSLSILHRTDHAPGPASGADLHYLHNGTIQLGMKHSALSRAFVRTIGRLGRWKRALNSKAASRPASVVACNVGVSAFDLEVTAPRDLLTTNSVERYLQMTDPVGKFVHPPVTPPSISLTSAMPIPVVTPIPSLPPIPSSSPSVSESQFDSTMPHIRLHSEISAYVAAPSLSTLLPQGDAVPVNTTNVAVAEHVTALQHSIPVVERVETHTNEEHAAADIQSVLSDESSRRDDGDRLREPSRAYSFRSSSTDSFGAPLTSDGPLPLTFPGHHNQWQFDVVSIDDLDLSDTSSLPPEDPAYPPGLRKPPRRLPNRREFEFVRRSEVSSMGIVSQESMRDSFASSSHSERSATLSGPKPIHKWQMKSLQQTFESMSDEEDGDVEAALRRLEGHINPKTQQEKAEKVDGWVRNLRERLENGDYDYESSLFSEDEIEGFIDEVDTPDTVDSGDGSPLKSDVHELDQEDAGAAANTPVPTQMTRRMPGPLGPITVSRKASKPPIEDAVPIEILQSRMPSVVSFTGPSAPTLVEPSSKVGDKPQYLKSFIVDYSSEILARHFSMIDRELFMGVKFEELVSEDWLECEEIHVLDWAQYLKDRARWKVEGRFAVKTTALAALRARFNLMVSFVISEVVLTAPAQRTDLVNRFIRIAWKSYAMSNFHTMTAIITALQNSYVQQAMRKLSRIGIFEKRVYEDLVKFTSCADDFKLMRDIVESIVDSKPLDSSNAAGSVVSGSDSQSGNGKLGTENIPPKSCIPFIGTYLSQLHRYNKLPALIDPTAPHSVIGIDTETAIFDPPAHPEVFANLAPLPESMHLEPLINVHKQRKIAEVIKSLVAGQHLASRVHFDIDKRLFQRCLRLHGLDTPALQKASNS